MPLVTCQPVLILVPLVHYKSHSFLINIVLNKQIVYAEVFARVPIGSRVLAAACFRKLVTQAQQ
jgi:hypothetical protein